MGQVPENEWIEWAGDRQPVADDVRVEIKWWDAEEGGEALALGCADAFWWPVDGSPGSPLDGDIVAYRVVPK